MWILRTYEILITVKLKILAEGFISGYILCPNLKSTELFIQAM